MKKYFLIALLVLGTVSAKAQEAKNKRADKTPAEKAEKMTKRMTKQLDLSDEQVVKVKAINLTHITAMDSLDKEKLTAEERKTKKKTIMSQHETAMAGVLTAEQMTKFKEKKKKMKGKRKKRGQESDGDDD